MKLITLFLAFATATLAFAQTTRKNYNFYVGGGYFTSATLLGRFDYKSPVYWLKSGHATFGVGFMLNKKWQQRPEIFVYDVGYSAGGPFNRHGVYCGVVYQFVYNANGVVQPSFGPYVSTLLYTNESRKSEYTPFDAGLLTKISIRPIRQYGFAAYVGFTLGFVDMYEFKGINPLYQNLYNKFGANALLIGASWRFDKKKK